MYLLDGGYFLVLVMYVGNYVHTKYIQQTIILQSPIITVYDIFQSFIYTREFYHGTQVFMEPATKYKMKNNSSI